MPSTIGTESSPPKSSFQATKTYQKNTAHEVILRITAESKDIPQTSGKKCTHKEDYSDKSVKRKVYEQTTIPQYHNRIGIRFTLSVSIDCCQNSWETLVEGYKKKNDKLDPKSSSGIVVNCCQLFDECSCYNNIHSNCTVRSIVITSLFYNEFQ